MIWSRVKVYLDTLVTSQPLTHPCHELLYYPDVTNGYITPNLHTAKTSAKLKDSDACHGATQRLFLRPHNVEKKLIGLNLD